MTLKEAATLLCWNKDSVRAAIDEGVKLPKTGVVRRLAASPADSGFDVDEEALDEFIQAFETEEPGRHPPVAVRRELLVESSHKCGICGDGSPLIFHHILAWADLSHHDPAHMLAVCGTCNEKIHRGQIDTEMQRMHKARLGQLPTDPHVDWSGAPTRVFGSPELPSQQAMWRHQPARPSPTRSPETVLPQRAYSEYIYLEHFTALAELPKRWPVDARRAFWKLTDEVRASVKLHEPHVFTFVFARRQEDWDASHVKHQNEYTWQMGSSVEDLRELGSAIDVEHMTVGLCKLECISREVARDRISIVMSAEGLGRLWGKEVEMAYRVTNVYPKAKHAMFTSLHAPARSLRFTLTMAGGFPHKPVVASLFAGTNVVPDIVYHPAEAPSSVTVRVSTQLASRSGLVVRWAD